MTFRMSSTATPTLHTLSLHDALPIFPRGYDECLVWGTIGWTIPLSRYPDTHNKQPLCYVALSSQKNYCVLYLFGPSWSASQLEQLKAGFKAAGKKLDMGKCCVNFDSPDDLPLEAIGKLISEIS